MKFDYDVSENRTSHSNVLASFKFCLGQLINKIIVIDPDLMLLSKEESNQKKAFDRGFPEEVKSDSKFHREPREPMEPQR